MLKSVTGISIINPSLCKTPSSKNGRIPNKSNGFTFIELMVVLLILGIVMHFATLSWGDFGERRRIVVAAEQIHIFLNTLQDEAILENSIIGIRVRQHNYELLRFQPQQGWIHISNQRLHQPQLPPQIILHTQATKQDPTIIIDAQGNSSVFKLDLGTNKQPIIATIVGDNTGNISLKVH